MVMNEQMSRVARLPKSAKRAGAPMADGNPSRPSELRAPLPFKIERFIDTPVLAQTQSRIESYLAAGYPVHLRGPAGSGKTSLALRVATERNRPVVLLTGDASYSSANLVGREAGTHTRRMVDRYIESVTRMDIESKPAWIDELLTHACLAGHTLVYDEFTRSPPEANNVLLSALQERILVLPAAARGEPYVPVHPEFTAIFTSNPVEYAGVHDSQDALLDRMITIDLDYPDRDSEIAIVEAHSDLGTHDVTRIVDLVRDVRASGEVVQRPSVRAALMIAKIAALEGWPLQAREPRFVQLCLDILESKTDAHKLSGSQRGSLRTSLVHLIDHYFPKLEVA